MRNIAVSLTIKQVANSVAELLGQPKPHPDMLGKTVSRRDGWDDLQPGELLCLVEKGMGIPRGQKVNRLALVHVTSVRRERLDAITPEDVRLEGFDCWCDFDAPCTIDNGGIHRKATPAEFITFFGMTHKGTKPASIITRIEWRYVGGPEAARKARAWMEEGWRFDSHVSPVGYHPLDNEWSALFTKKNPIKGRSAMRRHLYPDGTSLGAVH